MKFLKSRVGSNFLELTLEKSIFFDVTSSSFISSTSMDISSDSILLSVWVSFSIKLSFCFFSSLLSSSNSISEFKTSNISENFEWPNTYWFIAERTNGRLAMIGFMAVIINYSLFGWIAYPIL